MRLTVMLCVFACVSRQIQAESVDQISSSLFEFFEQSTQYTILNQRYQAMIQNSSIENLNLTQLLENMTDSLNDQIDIVASVLGETTKSARELYKAHINTSCCCMPSKQGLNETQCRCNVSYNRIVAGASNDDLPLTSHHSFGVPVDLNSTSVHIPVNVYDKEPGVLCFIEWSQNLKSIFMENWDNLTNNYPIRVTHQFVGSSTGLFYHYPSSPIGLLGSCENCPYERVDTYNAKSRPWYIETVAGDKAIAILLDMSGSMTGTQSMLAKLTAIELIQDLPVNDLFMVLRVDGSNTNRTFQPIGNCFQDLVQASTGNKIVINDIISKTEVPYGKADFEDAMNFAKMKLINSTACHKIIIIFSDGDAHFPIDTFDNRDGNRSLPVAVFSFQVALRHDDSSDMQKLACKNKGIFRRIKDFDSISLSTQAITEELNRHNNLTTLSSSTYIDAFTQRPITTFSMPIKITVNGTTQFIGVTGMDIISLGSSLSTLGERLGSLGYIFLIGNNGVIVTHPLLSELLQTRVEGAIDVFDMNQLEFESSASGSSLDTLRSDIMDRRTGELNISSYVVMEHQKRFIIKDMTYYYKPAINRHTVTNVVAKVPAEGVSLISSSPLSVSQLNELLQFITTTSDEILVASDKRFCHDQNIYDLTNTSGVLLLLDKLIHVALAHQDTSSTECSGYLYEPLLTDLYFMYSNKRLLANTTDSPGHISSFAKFDSGLLWCWRDTSSVDYDCASLFHTNYVGLTQNNGNWLSVYRGTYLFDSVIVAVRHLYLPSNPMISLGVLGVVFSNQPLSNENATYMYLLDEGGYVVSGATPANDTNNTVFFFGHVHPAIFNDLVRCGLFIQHNITGYSTRPCTISNSTNGSSSGTKLTGVVITFVTMIGHLLTTVFLSTLQSLFTFAHDIPTVMCPTIHLCQTKVTFYLADYSAIQSVTDDQPAILGCSGHDNISYWVAWVTNTSLIAVFTNNSVCESDYSMPVGEKPFRLPCQCYNQPYRGTPSQPCYDDDVDFEECSAFLAKSYGFLTVTFISFLLQPFITLMS